MRHYPRFVLDVLLGMTLFVGATILGAQMPTPAAAESTLDARTRQLAAQLRCPVCQGLSLQDSPSELSQQMRDVVRQQLAAGRTPDEVKAYFVGRYGEWILMEPQAHGFNWIVYVLPLLILAGAAWTLSKALRKWTRAPPSSFEEFQEGETQTLL
ncbi:MAG TPA: cytochrome c-type biogenesis protein [Gemmatimonadaceae bacterium]